MAKIATRESYGQALVSLGHEAKNVVVLDADLSVATKTCLFRKEFPKRHINCGIAEANMIGVAAGLSTTGKIPFVSTFAMFAAGRAYEQIRNSVAYPHLNVKIAATHAGISVGPDGATHQCNEDIALMRTIPGMVVINPADDIEAKAAVKAAYEYEGPVYLRFSRLPSPIINTEGYQFQIGKGVLLKEGTDITIIATGLMVFIALEVSHLLELQGINARVINFHTLKPLDHHMLQESIEKTKCIFTLEEHSIIGGLGSAVLESMNPNNMCPVHRIGIEDSFGESGDAEELFEKYGLSSNKIYEKILNLL